jgi:MYXO-CTERM domain-containing protein
MYQGGAQIGSTFTYTTNPTITRVGFVSDGSGGQVSAFQLTAVPEPTAALLGTLGMLALLRRRRA